MTIRDHTLEDGANIAVIGGGPSGSFFSIFALKMARMLGKELNITIFEPKDFTKTGPAGCNRCGGIISELLLQTLAVEGINLPETVVRKGIDSYKLHTNHGSVYITTPAFDKTIATVSRGGGPKGILTEGKESFDQFLLSAAEQEGAVRKPLMVDRLEYRDGLPRLFSQKQEVMTAEVVVGAFGVNSRTTKLVENLGFGYQEPPLVTASIAELGMSPDAVAERFGNSIHLFLIPDRGVKFAAMIPKGSYVTLCILGNAVDAKTVADFLEKPVAQALLKDIDYRLECRCLPKMNVGAPKKSFADRMVMCGDAGSTRLFKDGLGAAYLMGKAAAKTVVFHGVSREDFRRGYHPLYKSIITDNYYGRYLYAITDVYRKNGFLTKGMLNLVRTEQGRSPDGNRILSSILWDMFTGNERYKAIVPRALSVRMHLDLWRTFACQLAGLS